VTGTADDDDITAVDEVDGIRPARPGLVELAAAILIVGGAMQLIVTITTLSGVPPGAGPFLAIALALNVASIVLGALVRLGRAWLVAINFSAVVAFLDLLGSGGSPLSLTLGAGEVLVVAILLARKPWFDAMRAWRAEMAVRSRP
jgi:hypothetical protein